MDRAYASVMYFLLYSFLPVILFIVDGEIDYLRKMIVQGRSSKTTKVGDIMTEEVYQLLGTKR